MVWFAVECSCLASSFWYTTTVTMMGGSISGVAADGLGQHGHRAADMGGISGINDKVV